MKNNNMKNYAMIYTDTSDGGRDYVYLMINGKSYSPRNLKQPKLPTAVRNHHLTIVELPEGIEYPQTYAEDHGERLLEAGRADCGGNGDDRWGAAVTVMMAVVWAMVIVVIGMMW